MKLIAIEYLLAYVRISLGLIFLWAFFDKLFGLGFATAAGKSWFDGVSPTVGFLKFGTTGPLAPFYKGLAGNVFVDWLFMIGLLGIGFSLIAGIGVKIAGYSGALMMLLMWSALLPPKNHPFLDNHIIYLIVLLVIAKSNVGQILGLGKWWSQTNVVLKYKFLE